MTRDDIKAVVIHRIAAELKKEEHEITEQTDLFADLGIDSILFSSLFLLLEDEPVFEGITFDEDKFYNARTVADLIGIISVEIES